MDFSNNSENDSCRDDLSENITEGMERNDNIETNDSNREDLSENVSSQENQSSGKLVVNTSKNISDKTKKVKKFNCEKRARVKVHRDNSCHMLTHGNQKVEQNNEESSENSVEQ